MTWEKLKVLINKLIVATKYRKVKWEEDDSNEEYTVIIGGCPITVSQGYYAPSDESIMTLKIANQNGRTFERYSYSNINIADENQYMLLYDLYMAAKDSVLSITESENAISEQLDELTKDFSLHSDGTELPFG